MEEYEYGLYCVSFDDDDDEDEVVVILSLLRISLFVVAVVFDDM
jgi:hypothetical protein